MILLETDHISVLGSERCTRLTARLAMAGNEVIGTTIITVEEQMRGWMASISKGNVRSAAGSGPIEN